MAFSKQSQSRVKSLSNEEELGNDSDDPSSGVITPSVQDEESAIEVNDKIKHDGTSRAVSGPSEVKDIEGKPIMPRAKRIISFDDQTSRLSRSKLVVV